MSDEATIVKQARTGDRAAFEELVRRTSRLVYARLYLECGNASRAEDLVQDTFIRAMKAIGTLTDDATFRPWLLSIARNVFLDDVRNAARLKRKDPVRSDTPVNELLSNGPPPTANAEREETRQRVLAALRSLPEEYQLPLSLRYLAGADYDTISQQLGLTNGSLRGLLHRGLKQLKERLPSDLC
ncbi:sigma-70 family RNA polymerase sigma factor [soil metagenome]